MHEPEQESTWLERLDLAAARRALVAIDQDAVDVEHKTFGDYIVVRRLGGGGGGDVFLAIRHASDHPVALKVLNHRLGETPQARRAWRELQVLEQLRMESIPRLLDHGVHDGRLYMATEFIDGLPLITHCETLRRERRMELLARVADVVQKLHEQGVIHRDLKPSNMLVDRRGQPVLVDLGIATLLRRDAMETLTVAGAPIGSPAFMAPEQARGEAASTRSDVYGLGATGYVLATEHTPHDMDVTLHEAIRRVARDEARDPRQLDPSLSVSLAAVLRKAVALNPDERYSSAAEFAADLRRWLHGEPVTAADMSISQRVTRFMVRHPIIGTTIVCLLIASVVFVATWISLWWAFSRPYDLYVDPVDHSWVALVSYSGRPLHRWNTSGPIVFARILDREPEFGGGRIVLVGSGSKLRVYEFSAAPRLLWTTDNSPPGIQMPTPISVVRGEQFKLSFVQVADVFPESAGAELIVAHRHTPFSPTVVRIYDQSGQVLYEFWHDGVLHDVRWLASSNLLILCGVNSEGNWHHRGHREVRTLGTPIILFAIRPRIGEIRREWIRCGGGKGTLEPLWYRCLLPPEEVDAFPGRDHSIRLGRDPAGFVLMLEKDDSSAGLWFRFDTSGNVIDCIANDPYRLRPELPDPQKFYFAELPPLLKSPLTE